MIQVAEGCCTAASAPGSGVPEADARIRMAPALALQPLVALRDAFAARAARARRWRLGPLARSACRRCRAGFAVRALPENALAMRGRPLHGWQSQGRTGEAGRGPVLGRTMPRLGRGCRQGPVRGGGHRHQPDPAHRPPEPAPGLAVRHCARTCPYCCLSHDCRFLSAIGGRTIVARQPNDCRDRRGRLRAWAACRRRGGAARCLCARSHGRWAAAAGARTPYPLSLIHI